MIKPGQDPHGYEPTPKDMVLVEKADLLFTNGFGLEEGLLRTLENVSTGTIVAVSEDSNEAEDHDHEAEDHDHEVEDHDHEAEDHDHEAEDHDHEAEDHDHEAEDHDHEAEHHDHHHGSIDPHTWMSPLNVMEWSERIAEALSELDPANKDYYHDNAKAYIAELKKVHQENLDSLAAIPADKRVLVTDHDAFGYYADLYGFRVAGTILPNLSTSSETSAKNLSHLVDIMETENLNAVFIGSTAGNDLQKLAAALKSELGRNISIKVLLTGSLTEAGGDADNYLDFLRYNTRQIVNALK